MTQGLFHHAQATSRSTVSTLRVFASVRIVQLLHNLNTLHILSRVCNLHTSLRFTFFLSHISTTIRTEVRNFRFPPTFRTFVAFPKRISISSAITSVYPFSMRSFRLEVITIFFWIRKTSANFTMATHSTIHFFSPPSSHSISSVKHSWHKS